MCCVGYILQIQASVPSHLATLERGACWWSRSSGSTSGLPAKWVQNGAVRTVLLSTSVNAPQARNEINTQEILYLIFIAPKYSSVIPEHFMPQRMLMRSVNMNWVSFNHVKTLYHNRLHSDFAWCPGFAATRLQAKYKGYRAKGEFRKQKEAGKCHKTGYTVMLKNA